MGVRGKVMQRKHKYVMYICLFLYCMFFFSADCYGQTDLSQREVIKVGYYNIDNYYYVDEDDNLISLDVDYLNKISEYTNYSFVYVDCKTWENALNMLSNHEIDLLGTMQRSLEREQKYAICEKSYGISVAEIVALADSEYIYEDYEAIDKATIGVVEDYVRISELLQLFEEKNISPDIVEYKDQKELMRALEAGSVDMIAACAHTVEQEYNIVEKYAHSSLYFASWKGNNQLIDDIDEALIQINLYESDFDDRVIEKFFPVIVNSPFTKTELDCISENNTYTIYMDRDCKPLASYNESTGKIEGILVDICIELEKVTGLNFEFMLNEDVPTNPGGYDVTLHILNYGASIFNGYLGGTNSILDEDFSLYYITGSDFDADRNAHYKVATMVNRDGIYSYFKYNYPQYELVLYDSPEKCFESIINGDCDFTFLNEHVANYVIIEKDYSNIDAVPTRTVTLGYSLQFYGEESEILSSIVNKCMTMMDTSAIQDIILEYALLVQPDITVEYILKNNIEMVSAVALLTIALVTIIVVCITYAIVMRQQKMKVESANNAKNEFYSRMSHDMRTPMNGILGIADLCEDEDDINVLKSNIGKIKDSGEYLLGLINDTLDFQRIESGKMVLELQKVRIEEVVNNIVDMVKTTANKKNLDFKIDVEKEDMDCYVKLDPLRTRQIFVNLLSNALKFTEENGKVVFRMERIGSDDTSIHYLIEVSDTGVGMSKNFINSRLYNPFEQETNIMSMRYAGSGLGLSIVKSLVEIMGGRIEVESEIGQGTRFRVYLDFEKVDAKDVNKEENINREHEEEINNTLTNCNILMCEDHPLNAEITTKILEKVNCSVKWCSNGKEGVEVFKKSKVDEYDAILMDIRMPVMDGITAAKKIRQLDRTDAAHTPIIAMTANAYEEDIRQTREAGMNAHLAKPIDKNLFYETLAKLIKEKYQ